MFYHLAVLSLISKAAGEVSSTSSPTTAPNRLLETPPHHHCPIHEHYRSDCEDQTILPGTKCLMWFDCEEHSYPSNPVLQICQENSDWDGETEDPNCDVDNCPIIEGYQAYQTGGCEGRNEGGIFFEDGERTEGLENCALRCDQDRKCRSFEFSKLGWDHHAEPNRCSLSRTCTYEESRKILYSDTCLYEKGKDVDGGNLSNNDGESTHHRHCEFKGDLEFFASSCDGNVLTGTKCDFWKFCKESQHSIKSTLVCLANGEWDGPILENGLMWDANCYDDFTATEESMCSEMCPNNPATCKLCYDEEVLPTPCPSYSIDCVAEIGKSTTSYFESSKCASFSLSKQQCHATGGDFVVQMQACVGSTLGQETCVTQGGDVGVSMSTQTKFKPGYKACHLVFGYMCDKKSGLKSMDRVVVVPEDQPCPSNQDWTVSCDLLSNTVLPPPPKPSDDNGGGACLGYDSEISLADGTTQPIHSLQVGTNVALGNDDQSAIVFFSHADKAPVMRNMVTIKTQETNITATRKHLIFSSENKDVTLRNLRAFEEVKVGDYVLMDSESGPVSTKVIDIISQRMFTRVFNAVPTAGYLIANKIFVASGVAFGVLPHWLQYPVVHAVSMLLCGISERSCQIEENETKPRWVRSIQEWIAAMDLNRVSSAMMLTGSYA